MVETILQSWIVQEFALFFLIFFVVFAILEKTKIFGEERKQINALIAFVIGLIFIAAVSPKDLVNNLILFLTVAIIIVFVALLIWGFATGSTGVKIENKYVKGVFAAVVIIALIIFIIWVTGINIGYNVLDFLFFQGWSGTFWTNFLFIAVVIVALFLMLKYSK